MVTELLTDPVVRRYLGGVRDADQIKTSLAGYFHEPNAWSIYTDTRSIGVISLSSYDNGGTELSYQLKTDAWGFGYATEAGRKVLEFAENELHLKRVFAETQSANLASIRLLERLGFVKSSSRFKFGAEQSVFRR